MAQAFGTKLLILLFLAVFQHALGEGLAGDRIDSNVCIVTTTTEDACKTSPSGRYALCMQRDANVVAYRVSKNLVEAYWSSSTKDRATALPLRLCMQADGNLVAYDNTWRAFWTSNTAGKGGQAPMTLFVQNDGNVVAYDAKCTPFWSTNSLMQPAEAPPCGPGSNVRVSLKGPITTGPYGDGSGPAFDDSSLANNGANRITRVDARSGFWIDAIRFSYGTSSPTWRGGNGGTTRPALVLGPDEWIAQAWVRTVDHKGTKFVSDIEFITNTGRTWSSSDRTTRGDDRGVLASPCPLDGYRLISVKGMTNSSFLGSIQFTWGVAPGAQGPLVSELAQWRFFPSDANDGLTPAFRAVNGQPECFSLDGKSCFTDLDGFSLRMCAASTKSRVRCTPADGARDPIHWCTRARGALGLTAPAVPIRAIFYNVDVCNSGPPLPSLGPLQNVVYNDPHSLKRYWRSASAGRAFLDESTSAIVNLRVPCSVAPITDCEVRAWFNFARDNASALGGRKFSDYQYHVFVAPTTSACQSGSILGFSLGTIVWVRGRLAQIEDLNGFKHELGHSLGLPHTGRVNNDDGVGDNTTPMGYCPRCIYNSIDQLRLGWSRALPIVDWSTISGTSQVKLPALSDLAAYNELGVVVIRLQDQTEPAVPGGNTRYIYVSYRVTKGQDKDLPPKYDGSATFVHGGNSLTWILGWVKDGQAYVNTPNRMLIRQDSSNVTEARITICKWVTASSEC